MFHEVFPGCLTHEHTAVYVYNLAGDIASRIGCKKGNRSRNVLRRAVPCRRNLRQQCFARFLRDSQRHISLDKSRGDRVHGNVPGDNLARKGSGKADNAGLSGRIITLPRISDHADHRSDIDNTAVTAAHHGFYHRLRAKESAFEVGIHNIVPFAGLHQGEEVVLSYSSVVYKHIDSIMRIEDLLERSLDRGGVGHAELHERRSAAPALDKGRCLLCGLRAGVVIDNDMVFRTGHLHGNATADPTACSGYHDNALLAQSEIPQPFSQSLLIAQKVPLQKGYQASAPRSRFIRLTNAGMNSKRSATTP